jgi:carboxyl-terminal processing protease
MRFPITLLFLLLALAFAAVAGDPPEFFGIGAVLSPGDETTGPIIQSIVPDSPAARAQLTPGLIISRVDGHPTVGMDLEECVKRIRGEPGSPVLIEVTDPATGKIARVVLLRASLPLGVAPE